MTKPLLIFMIVASSTHAMAWSILDDLNKVEVKKDQVSQQMIYALNSYDNEKYEELFKFRSSLGKDFFKIIYSEEELKDTQMIQAYSSLSEVKAPQSSVELCAMVAKPYAVNQFLANRDNRMAFTNPGGTFATGLCWWHTSLTRSAAMLSIYQPNSEKPTNQQATKIIDTLIDMAGVVTIPGFRDWKSFSDYFSTLIESRLSAQQRQEVLDFTWVRALKGTNQDNAKALRENLERAELEFRLYRKPVYVMLQYSGPATHAWLILDIKKSETGYSMYILDSNSSAVQQWEYTYGQPHLIYASNKKRKFIPYIQPKERQDLFKLKAATDSYCRPYKKYFKDEFSY